MLKLLGKKIGMTQTYLPNGSSNAITIVKLFDNIVIDVKERNNEVNNIKIGFNKLLSNKSVSKSVVGFFKSKNIPTYKFTKESLTSINFKPEIGSSIDLASIIRVGEKISVQGVSSGKGFAGVMKRWNFRGLEASHGVSVSHRSHGSTGQRQDPGKTFKGKKMAGHLGCDNITVSNLKVSFIDNENSVIGLYGSIPGNNGQNIVIKLKNI